MDFLPFLRQDNNFFLFKEFWQYLPFKLKELPSFIISLNSIILPHVPGSASFVEIH